MTIASNHRLNPAPGDHRSWFLVVAATGWVVLTTVAVLLATDTWSVGQTEVGEPRVGEPGRTQDPGTGVDGRLPVPPQRVPKPTPEPSAPTPRPPAPRADHEGLVYAGHALALIPRQATTPTAEH